ncbi:MAG: hypothetical protein HOL98_10055 [Gammaproteobacteria bacterium]|jgi:hypothetical protein|nr:hypothetical protein [Gammaproteobacteria bacterium]MBT5203786.1 hypothetical protein [Gammaproteobacteria bacterium]MBT5600610.1 hypothetical protein [Gammaproteobacteria bacterium]MBT6246235.1 hypothetical protein [Gammaproteobacteria bacterium]
MRTGTTRFDTTAGATFDCIGEAMWQCLCVLLATREIQSTAPQKIRLYDHHDPFLNLLARQTLSSSRLMTLVWANFALLMRFPTYKSGSQRPALKVNCGFTVIKFSDLGRPSKFVLGDKQKSTRKTYIGEQNKERMH